MTTFGEFSPEEQACHLRDPVGTSGMVTADALADINRNGNLFIVGSLDLAPGDSVLEVGCGLATMAPVVIEAAADTEYVGLDWSETMIEAACERHRT